MTISHLYLMRMLNAPMDVIDRSLLAHRAAELGVHQSQICRECRWPKLLDGRCVDAARRAIPASFQDIGLYVRVLQLAPTDAFSPCSREKPRIQRVRLEALMSALTTLAPLWVGLSDEQLGAMLTTDTDCPIADSVVTMLFVARGVTLATSGRQKDRDSLRLAFAASDLAPALDAWGAVRDSGRSLYPAEALPALDEVWGAWSAYKEVA